MPLTRALFFLLLALVPVLSAVAQQAPFDRYGADDGLTADHIYDVLQGADGNIWLATNEGVHRLSGFDFEFFEVPANSPVRGLYLDGAKKLWCFTENGQVYYFDNGFRPIDQNQVLAEFLDGRNINTMAVAGNLYVGSEQPGRLLQVGPANEVSAVSQDPANFSHYIRELEPGIFVWGASTVEPPNKLLQVFLQQSTSAVSLSAAGEHTHSCLIPLPDGTLLFGHNYELVHLNAQQVLARLFLEKPIEDMLLDQRGQLWVALKSGGVRCYVSGNIDSKTPISYLDGQWVTSIAEDQLGDLWFGTMGSGLFTLPSAPAIAYKPPARFTETNTEEVEEVRQTAVVEQTEAAPAQGEARFVVTDNMRYDTLPPQIYITGLRIVDETAELKPEYELAYDQNYLLINYGGAAYSNAEKLQYSFMLEGLDTRWRFTDQTSVQYTTLPPGSYTFRVRTMNKDGIWSEDDAVMTFHIAPPFWQTWWFLALMSLLLFVSVGLVLLLSVQRVKRKEQEKVAINKKIAEIELQALRAQMNPHFFFNTLSSIQHYITTNDNDQALKYMSKFAKLMRRIMDNSRKGVISIREELDALKLYLELESLRFKGKFDFELNVEASIDVHYDQIPAMLIQPYVENAILHGIMYKEDKGQITISLSRANEVIKAVVEDNGVGRARAREIKASKNATHQSSGMDITRERLEILNAANNSNLSVNIIDLTDAQGNATGTRVEVFVPASDN